MRLKGGITKTAGLIILICAPFLLARPERTLQKNKVPQHDAAAIIKLVTVRVLDREGRPVTGLKKEDFVLYDNGVKKAITEFEIHTLGAEGMEVLPSGDAAGPPEPMEGMNRKLFIFLDIQGSGVSGMANAKEAALHFVDAQLHPSDEVGILAFSPTRGFLIQEYLTTDHERIRNAISKTKDIESMPSPGFVSTAGGDDSVRDRSSRSGGSASREDGDSMGMMGSGSSPFGYSGSAIATSVPGSRRGHRGDFIPQMFDLTQALKYIPGNKSLIIFTARTLGPYAAKLGKEFASASTPVYTVNTGNWVRQGVMTLSVKKKHVFEDHPLQALALASGGKYFADIEDVETIAQDVQSLTGNFFVLGYYIEETWDGEYHQINIEVKKPGLQVLAQHGYFNPLPFAELTAFQKKLHLFDLVFEEKSASPERLDIPVAPLFISGEEKTNCVMLSRFNIDEKIGVSPSKVEIFALIFDGDQKVVREMNGEIDFSPFDNEILVPYFQTDLPAGQYECRIVTRDLETGQACVGKSAFCIPDTDKSGIILTSPLLFARGLAPQIFKFSKERRKKAKEKDLTLGDIYRYLPTDHHLIVGEIDPGINELLAVLPVTYAAGSAPEAEITVWLHPGQQGAAVELPLNIIGVQKIRKDKSILIIETQLPELPPGEYDLEFEALEKNTSTGVSTRRSIIKR